MTNPVRQQRLSAAFKAFRGEKPWFCSHNLKAIQNFMRTYEIVLTDEDVKDFWRWFCGHNVRSISEFTTEQILWGVEKFIELYAPVDSEELG